MGGVISQIGNAVSQVGAATLNPMMLLNGAGIGAVGGALGGNKNPADDQAQGVNQANAVLEQTLKDQNSQLQPYQQAGLASLNNITGGKIQMDPGYQFRLDEGNKAINAAASARGNFNSGATLKALTRFGQDNASNGYQQAFQNQMSLAGLGANAAQNVSNNYGNYGQQVSNNYTGLGNARAANQIAQQGQTNQLIGQGIGLGTTLAMFSDARLKTNVEELSKDDLSEMKKHLKAVRFGYINNKFGDGEWVGVMAQDLLKSKLGSTLVFKDEQGHYQIHLPRVLSMFLANQAGE